MTNNAYSVGGRPVRIKGRTFAKVNGTRAQVWHGTAFKTRAGLTRNKLLQNKKGRIVSRVKHFTEKRRKQLVKLGFRPKKGTFRLFQKTR